MIIVRMPNVEDSKFNQQTKWIYFYESNSWKDSQKI